MNKRQYSKLKCAPSPTDEERKALVPPEDQAPGAGARKDENEEILLPLPPSALLYCLQRPVLLALQHRHPVTAALP